MKYSFERLADLQQFDARLKSAVVAIGNFDGVHRGHQQVLQKALDQAHMIGKPAIVLTFEPHPRTFFKPQEPVDRLTSAAEKAEILRLMGFDAVIEQAFTADFAALSADNFVRNIICGKIAATCVVTGDNFHFGAKRSGNPQFLQNMGTEYGFDVCVVDAFADEGGSIISSSRVRTLLRDGKVEEAAGLLGYHYTVRAPVIHGAALGRSLGFPTANMQLPPETNLKFGVYAVRFRRADGSLNSGVASFGRRPTVNALETPILETFLFDFSDDLYGEICSVSFFSRLRGELKFDGLDPLIAQMQLDEAEARSILNSAKPLGTLDRHLAFEDWD